MGTLTLFKTCFVFKPDTTNNNNEEEASFRLEVDWKDIGNIKANKATSVKAMLRLSHVNGKISYMLRFTNREILETVRADMKSKSQQGQDNDKAVSKSTPNTMNQTLKDMGEESMTETGPNHGMDDSSALLQIGEEKDSRRRRSSATNEQRKDIMQNTNIQQRRNTSQSLPVAAAELVDGTDLSSAVDDAPVVAKATPVQRKARSSTTRKGRQSQEGSTTTPTALPLPGKSPTLEPGKINTSTYTKVPGRWSISYQQLLDIDALAKDKFGSRDYPKKTMRDVCSDNIVPRCRGTGAAYALSLNQPDGLPVDAFITHSWDEPFGSFVASIKAVFQTFTKKPNLWVSLSRGSYLHHGNFVPNHVPRSIF